MHAHENMKDTVADDDAEKKVDSAGTGTCTGGQADMGNSTSSEKAEYSRLLSITVGYDWMPVHPQRMAPIVM